MSGGYRTASLWSDKKKAGQEMVCGWLGENGVWVAGRIKGLTPRDQLGESDQEGGGRGLVGA